MSQEFIIVKRQRTGFKNFVIFILALALAFTLPIVAYGQTGVTVVDMNGNTQQFTVRTFDLTPKVIPIKPYGMNLKPANIPQRKTPASSVNYAPAYNPGAVTIENPYFKPAKPTGSLWNFILDIIANL